jgi:hypothetical protein
VIKKQSNDSNSNIASNIKRSDDEDGEEQKRQLSQKIGPPQELHLLLRLQREFCSLSIKLINAKHVFFPFADNILPRMCGRHHHHFVPFRQRQGKATEFDSRS